MMTADIPFLSYCEMLAVNSFIVTLLVLRVFGYTQCMVAIRAAEEVCGDCILH